MSSRLRRFEERRLKQRMFLSVIGSIGILVFLGLFGLKILESFSLFVDKLRGSSPQPKDASASLLLPPTLNALPEATNSASLTITGKGQGDLTLILYINEAESTKTTIAKDGTFAIDTTDAKEGKNTISAKISDDKGNFSGLSNVLSILVKKTKPKLDVKSPEDGTKVTADSILVSGSTDEDTTVTVNGHVALIQNDLSFSYTAKLNEGDNDLTITATDIAGNQTTVERRVTNLK